MKRMPYPIFNVTAYAWVQSATFSLLWDGFLIGIKLEHTLSSSDAEEHDFELEEVTRFLGLNRL